MLDLTYERSSLWIENLNKKPIATTFRKPAAQCAKYFQESQVFNLEFNSEITFFCFKVAEIKNKQQPQNK